MLGISISLYVTIFSYIPNIGNGEFLLNVYPKNKFCVWQSVANDKIMGDLKSAILKCNAIIPRAVIREPLAVFNLAVVGRIGVLKLLSVCWYVEYLISEMAAPESIKALKHLPVWTVIVGQSIMHGTVTASSASGPPFMGCTTERGLS